LSYSQEHCGAWPRTLHQFPYFPPFLLRSGSADFRAERRNRFAYSALRFRFSAFWLIRLMRYYSSEVSAAGIEPAASGFATRYSCPLSYAERDGGGARDSARTSRARGSS
jgi:hypothetical protein